MKRVAIAALTLLLMGMVAAPTQAQTVGQGVGWIYISGASDGYVGNPDATEFVPFSLFVVAEVDYSDIGAPDQNISNGIGAWEMGVNMPASIIITGSETNPTNAVNLGSNVNWLVGLGQTFTAASSPIRLANYTCLITTSPAPTDIVVTVGQANPSTFGNGRPGFVDGQLSGECFLPDSTPTKCKRPFPKKAGVTINCVTRCRNMDGIGVENTSWGSVKANFGG